MKKTYKRRIKIIALSAALAASASATLSGCSSDESETYNILSLASTTVYGYVEDADGNKFTLSLGSVSSSSTPSAMEKPDGEGGANGEEPPEKPSGENETNGEEPSQKSGGANAENSDVSSQSGGFESQGTSSFVKSGVTAVLYVNDVSVIYSELSGDETKAELSDITEGSVIEIVVNDESEITKLTVMNISSSSSSDGHGGGNQNGGGNGGNQNGGNGGGGTSAPDSYSALVTYSDDADVVGEEFASTGTDENAILVNGATVTLSDVLLSRSSSDSTGGDNASFYGVGAALLVVDGVAYVSGGEINTDSAGGAGAFAYGDGVVYIAGATINTKQDTSGGIHVAGGGTLYAWNLTVNTEGNSSAAIRSDRGGGVMVVDGGNYTSNGTGSPAVYCTADITVNKADLIANNSEGICIEGLNSLRLYDCNLTASMRDDEQNDTTWSVIVYQSMSGDSEIGEGAFSMIGGSLTVNNGGVIYTTNTESDILLSDVDISVAEDCEFFLRCTGNNNARGWGSLGANGADCKFTAINQSMTGDVVWDSVSSLDFYMEDGSVLKGAFVDDETYAGNGGNGYSSLYISSDSSWIVTGDSYVTSLYNQGAVMGADGKSVSIVGTDGTVYVKGESEYTVTVNNYYTSADFSSAAKLTSFSSYEANMPDKLK